MLSPASVIAPVTANVILVAGVSGTTRQLEAGRRVDWALAGAGQITGVGDAPRALGGIFSAPPRIVDANHAIGETFARDVVLTRGTPNPSDNVSVLRGQTWISVGSAVEGTGTITASAPEVGNPATRQQTAVIHWVDARWTAPANAIVATGARHTLTSTVSRQTTGAPIAGWKVRYEITGGPSAGFAPDGTRSTELVTNAQGQAAAEIMQSQPEAGTSVVAVRLTRPAAAGVEELLIGSTTTQITWTTKGAAVHVTGPAAASVGSTASFRIDVTNPGPQPATGVVVVDALPAGLTLLHSTPPGDAGPGTQWTLGTLAAGDTRTIQFDARPDQSGTLNQCATLKSVEGLAGQDCMATTVQAATVELHLTGPDQAMVGGEVHFDLDVTNRGTTTAGGLVLTDRFDDGLVHAAAVSPIQRELDPLAAGQSRKISLTFKVTKPGRLCQTIDLTGGGGLQQTTSACVQAVAAAGSGKPALTVKLTAPPQAQVAQNAQFDAEIRNAGDAPVTSLRVALSIGDPQFLRAAMADPNFSQANGQLVWTIANLAPGQVEHRRMACTCLAVGRACARVSVSDGSNPAVEDETCVVVQAAAGRQAPGTSNLNVQIASRANPVKAGSDTSYQVTVTNHAATPEPNVTVVVTIPDLEQVSADQGQNPTRSTIDGQTVRFDSIAQLRAGESVVFEVHVRAIRAGNAPVHAEVTSQIQTKPLAADTTTSIFAEPAAGQ